MKIKPTFFSAALLFLGLSFCQAQFVTYHKSNALPLENMVTLTAPGAVNCIATAVYSAPSGSNITFNLYLDGTLVDSFHFLLTDGQSDSVARTFRTGILEPGNHTITFTVSGATSLESSLLLIADGEPVSGIQSALDQITEAFQSADAGVQAYLINQVNEIQSSLETRITILENQISALQASDNNQLSRIIVLENQLADLQAQQASLLNQLQTTLLDTVADLQSRIGSLETRDSTQTQTILELQNQVASLQQALNALGISRQIDADSTGKNELQTTDYLIIGGSAAGATALGVGIYSLLDQEAWYPSEDETPILDNQNYQQ